MIDQAGAKHLAEADFFGERAAVQEQFTALKQAKLPCMKGKDFGEFCKYCIEKSNRARKAKEDAPQHSPDHFWNMVSLLDALSAWSSLPNAFEAFLRSEKFDLIPLGKLYGEHQL